MLRRDALHSTAINSHRDVGADLYRSYKVHLVDDLMGENFGLLAQQLEGSQCLLVTTPTVAELYGDEIVAKLRDESIDITPFVLAVREETKTIDHVMAICHELQRRKSSRNSVLVGLGGGVCTDLVTMAASLFRRGIPYVRIPTTLLGQVDGSIGVKGAVNFAGKKNSLGCYFSPRAVFVDPAFLKTLPTKHLCHGIAEVIKMALVRDEHLFELVEAHGREAIDSGFQHPRGPVIEIVGRSILGMIEELETNIYEDQTYQRLVDFGHTIGPSIEAASGFTVPHGEAVAVGMTFSCELARELELMDATSCQRAIDCISNCGLPIGSTLLTIDLVRRALEEATRHRAGQLNLVLPTGIGEATFIESAEQIPGSALEAVHKRMRRHRHAAQPKASGSCLVFDIGGTNLRAAVYDPSERQLVARGCKPTPNHHRWPDLLPDDILRLVLQGMDDLAEELLDGQSTEMVSVAFAGPLNARDEITAAPTIWGTTNQRPVDLLSQLKILWPYPKIRLLNDVTAAGYRYLRNAEESLCMVTVGSGIGNKVFINGRPFTGPSGRGGEIGHIVVDHSPEAIVCDCGGRGHLGGIASGRGTLATVRRRAAQDAGRFEKSALAELCSGKAAAIENAHIVRCFRHGDPWTFEIVNDVAGKLANGLAHLHQSIGIERFVIFGGFATALGEQYRDCLVEAASRDCWASGQDWNGMVELGLDDDDSGLLGAGRFATEFCEQT